MNKKALKSKTSTVAVIVLSILVVLAIAFLAFSLHALISKKSIKKESNSRNLLTKINSQLNVSSEGKKAGQSVTSSQLKRKKNKASSKDATSIASGQKTSPEAKASSAAKAPLSVEIKKVFNFNCRFQIPTAKKLIFNDSKNGNTIPYRLFVPKNYKSSEKYPVILYLHGAGEIGTDNEKQISYISKIFEYSADLAEKAFILCPQTDEWWSLDSQYAGDRGGALGSVLHLLDYIKKNYSCDSNRIYVTGISMGGFATWDILEHYGSIFAAGIPVCGAGDTSKAGAFKNIPLRIYHGTDDETVSYYSSESMYTAIISAGGQKAEMISLQGIGHNAWDYAYADRDTLCWLFAQNKADNPTCQYEYIPYLRIIDSNGNIIISDEDVESIYYGESYEERRIVTVDLVLKSEGTKKLNNAYKSSSKNEFTVCWLNEKIYTYKSNEMLKGNIFSIVDIFDIESVKCFNKTINKTCFMRNYR